MRAIAAELLDGNQVVHDAGQILEPTPKTEQLLARAKNRDAFLDAHGMACGNRRGLLVGRGMTEGLIDMAVPACATIRERRPETSQNQPVCRSSRQSVDREHTTS